jgi:hypothetical protein
LRYKYKDNLQGREFKEMGDIMKEILLYPVNKIQKLKIWRENIIYLMFKPKNLFLVPTHEVNN